MKKAKKEFTDFTEVNAITPEELNNLQSLVSDFNAIQMKCGDYEIQKHQLLNRLSLVSQALEDLQAKLKEAYGDVVIDINTGNIKDKGNETNS